MSLHALRALRNTYPDLKITVATKARFARFYSVIPDVDILQLPPDGSFKSLMALVRAARESGTDCVADIHNTLRGKFIRNVMCLYGAKIAVLDKMRPERRRLVSRNHGGLVPMRHNVLRFCDVFARLGFPVPEPSVSRVRNKIPAAFGEKTGRWAGFAPFASTCMKIYPEEGRRRLVEQMAGEFDKLFIFTGPGREKEFALEMAFSYPNVVSVFGNTDIWGEMDLMSNLDIMVTMDSSAMHMASVVGTPVVSVWGATHPAAGFYAYGSDPDKTAVQVDLDCRPCSIYGEGKCRRGDFKCLSSISPEMIMEKVRQVLSSTVS